MDDVPATVMPFLTRLELQDYLQNVLKIDWSTVPQKLPTLEFLQEVYHAYSSYVPYSSLRYVTVPFEKRGLRSPEEVRDIGLKNHGGLCYDTHVFLSWVLAGLGYSVSYVLGKPYGSKTLTHVFLVVHQIDENGRTRSFLIDTCLSILLAPNLHAVDFIGDESDVYTSAFWDVKYVRRVNSEGKEVIRGGFRITDDTRSTRVLPELEPGWSQHIEFELKYSTLAQLFVPLNWAYADLPVARPTTCLVCFRFPEDRMCMLWRKAFIYEEDGRIKKRALENDDEILELVLTHFGDVFDRTTVENSIVAAHKLESLALAAAERLL